eukprot:CAMPEP_0184661900 /NCGR_PEP_ID=MMETSP0308-20130426/40762_1 /TAXON_ID=38269 /ORGANISM="Gloeochaete witrockiana, Strain SAG 46.84" /LENGTH=171 /DNA_ID=CAMNT_0027103555 /DNA_START=56 /DNA_END=571 /DNA_ORIENTATION=+
MRPTLGPSLEDNESDELKEKIAERLVKQQHEAPLMEQGFEDDVSKESVTPAKSFRIGSVSQTSLHQTSFSKPNIAVLPASSRDMEPSAKIQTFYTPFPPKYGNMSKSTSMESFTSTPLPPERESISRSQPSSTNSSISSTRSNSSVHGKRPERSAPVFVARTFPSAEMRLR